ncbi:helix-turn-helix domain-containing protein [Streptomyces bambusae]|uniref:helix-turn-helix domain-containing protein n=1 Tax=Streptomyces bambusae TaxID=1550616 RepID=UPI0040403AF2
MPALVEGRDREEAAALFKVPVRTADNWWARWRAGGPGRTPVPAARPSCGRAPGPVRGRASCCPARRSRSHSQRPGTFRSAVDTGPGLATTRRPPGDHLTAGTRPDEDQGTSPSSDQR